MSNSLYQDFTFIANNPYHSNDIVTSDNITFYYATRDFTSSTSLQTDINAGNFVGTINFNGITKPYFTWKSSYKFNNENNPIFRKIQFGDQYLQVAPAGINSLLMQITLPFTNIDLNQYTAILHFLSIRKGTESFIFVPPPPHNIQKLFRCEKWSNSQEFYNNYSITATFIESVV